MAIDLCCYSSLSLDDCDKKLNELRGRRTDLFANSFVLYSPRIADKVHQEIAKEQGFQNCASTFLVSLNEKQHSGRMQEVAEALKKQLGAEKVLVLQNNEFLR